MTAKPKLENTTDLSVSPDCGTAAALDPFDPAALRLDQSFVDTGGVKKVLLTVPVRKPLPQDWVRVHPGPQYCETLAIIELKDDREIFLLKPAVARAMPGEFSTVSLRTAINRQGVVFLWPVKLPAGGRVLEWHTSAMAASELAMKRWVRVKAVMSLGAYQTCTADGEIPEPEWPTLSFQELIRVAFNRGRLVESADHPVIRRLRGLP